MVFSSLVFLFAYLPITLLGYYLVPRQGRNIFLFIINLVFYGWGEPMLVLLMVFNIFINYIGGYLVDKYRQDKTMKLPCRIDSDMIPINKRKVGISILLSFVTFGIYLIYWKYLLVKNTRAVKKDKTSCVGEMLCLLFVPFYSLYWWVTRGELVKKQFANHNYSASGRGTIYLILEIFGLGIVAMAIMQNDFNSLHSENVDAVTQLNQRNATKRKLFLILTCVLDIGILAFFKYTGMLTDTLNMFALDIPAIKISLPIGISFYTFQTMSYVIDVYRDDAPVSKSFINFGTYVALFPQLIAGPIVRYRDVAYQLSHRRETFEQFTKGVKLFMVGFGKKVLIANQMGTLTTQMFSTMNDNGVLGTWVGIIAYTFQIYFDFSGYSDMACGLGNMLGFEFLKNFNYPYIAKSITDFWRRWHISLSTWFKEYVYIPLGGNRKGVKRQIINLLIVWGLTGLWHGAAYNFLLWGLYYGVILILEKFVLKKFLDKLPSVLQHIYAMLIVIIGWALFYFTDMAQLGQFFVNLVNFGSGICSDRAFYLIMSYLPILIVAAVASTPIGKLLYQRFDNTRFIWIPETIFCGAVLLIGTASLVNQSYNPFLYFRF